MKIVYMGTPEFAVAPLRELLENGYNIVGVVTMPDKHAGRGQKLQYSAVKNYANEHNLNLLQPQSLKDASFVAALKDLEADLNVVVAFRMLPEEVWNMPKYGTINLHASLLPEYRGAAPINWAIINGETESGVTCFRLKHEIDTGDIILQEKIDILPSDNAGTLHDKMLDVGAKLVVKSVEKIKTGNVNYLPQLPHSQIRTAPKIFKESCCLNFDRGCLELHNMVRGLSPYPTSWFEHKGAMIKVFETDFRLATHKNKIGDIITDNRSYCNIACKDGFLEIKRLQLAGKREMSIKDFLLGYRF